MEKRWVIAETDADQLKAFQKELNIHPALLQLLLQRGITDYNNSKNFFRPSLENLHDPFLMKDMDVAISRIQKAILSGEKILIYGDYDVDGTTSVATVYSFFKELKLPVDYYVPNRYTEGYGISFKGIDWAKEEGFTLIIALDCGVKANDKIEYGNKLGIDFIICDHHLPGDVLPNGVAVLDPKRKDCKYPYKELSGCGIGFKLISAFAQRNNISFDEVKKYLDFVVTSIASDIVPITGENRILSFYGLKKINEDPSVGLKALMQLNAMQKEMTISDIVFIIGPRINAAGRMEDARDAVRLLISGAELASSHAEVLNKHNRERKDFDSSITEEALSILQSDPLVHQKKTTVLFQPHWHKGVIGIVASRLLDKYYRPTIILCESNGMVSGSARSVAGFDIYSAINECKDLLEQFGGHMFAAGLTMKPENVEPFRKKFEEVVASTIDEKLLIPEIQISGELQPEDMNEKFLSILNQFAPFGPHNMKPVFITRQVRDSGWSKIVGGDHLKFSLKKNNSPTLHGIGFGLAAYINKVKSGKPFDVCYTLEETEWQGNKKIEMMMKDVK